MSPKSLRLAVLVVVIAVLAVVVVQNLAPALPLTVLGARTLAYPLGLWLGGSAGLGALTALALSVLVGGGHPPRTRSQKYRPRSFYEPPPAAAAAAADPAQPAPNAPTWDEAQGDWQDWNRVTSTEQWQSWDQVSASSPEPTAAGDRGFSFNWRRKGPSVEQQVADTMADIDEGWDGDNTSPPPGSSEVYDALDDINDGWHPADRPDNPTQVYADGSIYGNRYYTPGEPPPNQDNSADAAADPGDPAAPLHPPQVGQDGVVDADYRVIVPPTRDLEADPPADWDPDWDRPAPPPLNT